MNKNELIAKIAQESGLKKGEVKRLLAAFSTSIADSLSKGERVKISGFGSFVLSERKSRMGINPKTKEKMNIPPSVTARFKPSKQLKEQIK